MDITSSLKCNLIRYFEKEQKQVYRINIIPFLKKIPRTSTSELTKSAALTTI